VLRVLRLMAGAEQRYTVELTWDEIDRAMGALRMEAWKYEDEARARADASFTAEIDQQNAQAWEVIHKLGDARRVAHGEPLFDPSEL
jgi:hypothetical protein